MEMAERAQRVIEAMSDPVALLPPLLLSGSALASLPASLLGPPLSPIALSFLVSLSFLGGALELYYLLLVAHARGVLERSPPRLSSLLWALTLLSLYYFLIGIALLSLYHARLLSRYGCRERHGVLLDLATLGLALSLKQRDLAACLKERVRSSLGAERVD
ncbi:MAG: hypothetical protein N3F67_02695 [Acidilobaceae archaeon]|nr:hypothetical protein [Acidilobaceae archaeon]